jgi:hypothetical protein
VGQRAVGRISRRAAVVPIGVVALLTAACGPTVVAGVAGGPFATSAPSVTPTPTPTTPTPTTPSATPTPTTPSPTPTPTPTPSVPPLSQDSISLNGSPLSFLSPGLVPGWVKRLGVGTTKQNRTFYDDAATGLHVTVEVDLPLGLTPLEHARELSLDKQTSEEGYRLLALGPGPLGGATWAFTSVSTGAAQYVIDWFYSYPAFDAAILVSGPAAAKPLIKALWLEIVRSASVPIPYYTPSPTGDAGTNGTSTTGTSTTGTSTTGTSTTDTSTTGTSKTSTSETGTSTPDTATIPPGLANGGGD